MESPLETTTSYPMPLILTCKQSLHWADSSPVQILLSYREYFFRTSVGERLGITTLAPARIPISRHCGCTVPSAVVAGSRILGCISRITDSSRQVTSAEPAGSRANTVSLCGMNGPIPHISG